MLETLTTNLEIFSILFLTSIVFIQTRLNKNYENAVLIEPKLSFGDWLQSS